jgi:hypothetical protein
VELVELGQLIASGGDDLDAEERAALQRDLDASFEEEQQGQLIDLADALASAGWVRSGHGAAYDTTDCS